MTKTTSLVLITGTLILGSATFAGAQAPPPSKNIYFDVNFGGQPQSRSIATDMFPVVYNEVAIVHSMQEIGGSGFFDVLGGYRVWEDLSVGLGLTSTFASTGSAEVLGAIPHPLFFDTYRESTQTVEDLKHSELMTHLFVMWTSPVTDKIDASVSLGPTYVRVTQDLVTGINVPANTQSFTVITGEETESAWGFHIGGDVTYLLTPNIGVGGMLRYVWGQVDLPSAPDLDVAGFQFGGGVRFRF